MPEQTRYELLQVSPAASTAEIKAAYNKLVWGSSGSQEELRALNEAYAVLSDPGRRAEYDRSLAGLGTGRAGAGSGLAYDLIPVGPWWLRAWGVLHQWGWWLARRGQARAGDSWRVGWILLMLFVALLALYQRAWVHSIPLDTNLEAIAEEMPSRKYVRVWGVLAAESGYSYGRTRGGNADYPILFDGQNGILLRGRLTLQEGEFTGFLAPMNHPLRTKVSADMREGAWGDFHLVEGYYLDLGYIPLSPHWYLVLLAPLAMALPLLLMTYVQGYRAFRPQPLALEAVARDSGRWPVRVEATGRFQPVEGRRGGVFTVCGTAEVALSDEAGGGIVVTAPVQQDGGEWLCQLRLPAGSPVQSGVDYTGGLARPALQIQASDQHVLLRFMAVAEAHRVAGSLK